MTTTGTSSRSREAQTYLDGVGAALADLPEEERADLLDELAAHLDELAAEGTDALEPRLGSPEEYAAELRASAGLPPARAQGRSVAGLRTVVEGWLQNPRAVAVREFFWALRPAWWVLRAWLLVAAFAVFGGLGWSRDFIVIPAGVVGFVGMFAAIVASVQLGRGRLGGGGQRATGIAIVLNVFAVLMFIPVVATLADQARRLVDVQRYGAEQQYVERPPAEGVYAAGEQVWNIYPYDAQGRLLHDVRLYDQNGTPLDLGLRFDSTKKQVLDATGEQVDNAFPYRYLDPGTGEVADVEAAPEIVAPPLFGVPTGTPSPSPSGTPSPSPSDGKQ